MWVCSGVCVYPRHGRHIGWESSVFRSHRQAGGFHGPKYKQLHRIKLSDSSEPTALSVCFFIDSSYPPIGRQHHCLRGSASNQTIPSFTVNACRIDCFFIKLSHQTEYRTYRPTDSDVESNCDCKICEFWRKAIEQSYHVQWLLLESNYPAVQRNIWELLLVTW